MDKKDGEIRFSACHFSRSEPKHSTNEFQVFWQVLISTLGKPIEFAFGDSGAGEDSIMKSLMMMATLVSLGLSAETSQAQVWYRNPGRVAVPYGYGWGGYYGGGYSPVEGAQRGYADVIRSRGMAAEDYSRARINNEEARSKYLDNKLKWTEIYWQRKRLGEAELAKDYAKDRARRENWMEATRGRKPETLPASQFDPNSGGLDWPEQLQEPVYAEQRQKIEEELELQASTGTSSNAHEIRNAAREMQAILKGRIRDMTPNDYIACRKFLDRLVNQVVMAQAS